MKLIYNTFKTKQGLKELIDLGYTCKEVAELFNTKDTNIRYYCNKFNLKFNTQRRLNELEKTQILKDLENNISYSEICKKYNISENYISELANKLGISRKNKRTIKNDFNIHYFDTIDTEHKAYWLGFIMADGCISKTSCTCTRPNRLQINISYKDIDLLYKFCDDIKMDKNNIVIYEPNGTYSTNLMCKLYLNSVDLCDTLAIHGITQNKTTNENIPGTIPNNLLAHFIRGFFDGDGCYISSNNKIVSIEFCGSEKILTEIQDVFIKNNLIKNDDKRSLRREKRNNKKLFYLKYNKRYIKDNITNYMYNQATIFLERKKRY